jgi:plastocyanin
MPGVQRCVVTALLVVTALVVSACGSPTSGSPTSGSGDVRTITITVQGQRVTPPPARVTVEHGQMLRLVVTSDHDDELHAHGFDVDRELTAGQATTVDLSGAEPGLYDVETHHPELRLLQVQVR